MKRAPPLLYKAVSKGYTDIAIILIDNHRADVNAIDGTGYTPLHWTGYYGHKSTFEALLEVKDIDLLAKDKNSDTALYPAAVGNHIKCADHFIKELVKLDIRNHSLIHY